MSHCGAGLHAGWLNRVFVTPEVHRWHHSAKVPDGHKYSVPEKLGHPDGVADEGNYFKLFFVTRYLPRLPNSPRPAK